MIETSQPQKIYRAGTLRYTPAGLLKLCVLLLFGDFCITAFEAIFGPFMPLYLKQFNASNTMIAVVTTSAAGLMNILFLPNVGMWSDRTRTRWGRRVPFLMWAAPCTVLLLVLTACAPEIATWLQRATFVPKTISLAALTLAIITVFIVMWHFFNMVLLNAFQFLLRDVVPLELMPRFLAWFKFASLAGHCAFQWYLFEHLMDYPKTILIGVGVAFLFSFALIVMWVREGDYPPPPAEREINVFRSFAGYFQECLSLSLYRNYFIANALVLLGTIPVGTFLVLFAKQTLNLEMKAMGQILTWGTATSAILMIPMGYLCQRYNPFRIVLVALVVGAILRTAAFFVVDSQVTWLVYSVLVIFPTVAWTLGSLTVTMALFPAEKFGQFSSGVNAFGYGSLIVTASAVGWFMDYVGNNYRMVFIVSLLCYIAAIVPMVLVYRGWKKHGGPGNYVPPLPT